jgi:DNA-binding transcriptional MerR regulator
MSAMDQHLRIGQVGKITGLNPKTIRYYEEIGLMPAPKRSEATYPSVGYRLFTREDVARLTFIKRVKLLDLSLDQIRDLLTIAEDGCCTSVRPHLRSIVDMKLREVDERIAMLQALRGSLAQLYRKLPALSQSPITDAPCAIPECILPIEEVELMEGKEGVKAPVSASQQDTQSSANSLKAGESVLMVLNHEAEGGCCEPDCGPDTCACSFPLSLPIMHGEVGGQVECDLQST